MKELFQKRASRNLKDRINNWLIKALALVRGGKNSGNNWGFYLKQKTKNEYTSIVRKGRGSLFWCRLSDRQHPVCSGYHPGNLRIKKIWNSRLNSVGESSPNITEEYGMDSWSDWGGQNCSGTALDNCATLSFNIWPKCTDGSSF